MSEHRLIDANALNTSVALYAAENAYLNDTPLDILRMVSRWIAEANTISAVPVVRCRECKYAEKTVWSSGEMYCRVWKMNPRPDGFCHMGAKMDAQDMDVPTKDGGATDANSR